ncbi:MAG: permease-like cell division protein FtsX [Candidatus Caldatribacteriota bacterium]
MIFENFGFYLKEALLSFKRNLLMYSASIMSITVIFIIVGIFLLISLNLNFLLENIESQFEIIIYLKDNISTTELNNLKNDIASWEGVREVIYISKEEAFQRLLKNFEDYKDIFEVIEGNPLPASLEVKTEDSARIEFIAKGVEKLKGIEEVEYNKGFLEKWFKITGFLHWGGIAISIFLLVASVLIISNLTRITVYTRRNEIEIMSLMGATRWFIKWPFLIGGFLQGCIGAVIALAALYKIYFLIVDKVQQSIPFLPLITNRIELLPVGLIIVLVGCLVGFLGSMISVGRYILE